MARRKPRQKTGSRQGPRDGSGPRGGTAACPVTKSKSRKKK